MTLLIHDDGYEDFAQRKIVYLAKKEVRKMVVPKPLLQGVTWSNLEMVEVDTETIESAQGAHLPRRRR